MLQEGQRIERVTVLARAPNDDYSRRRWVLKCDCGTGPWTAREDGITRGRVRSCGCLTSEKLRQRTATHRMSFSPEYICCGSMIQRCTNPNAVAYSYYGGRGIKVCDRWMNFEAFYADMGPRPEGMSLDRIDSDGNYEPGNCRWATKAQQSQNTRKVQWVEFRGQRVPAHHVTLALGLGRGTISWRMKKHGQTAQEAVDYYVRQRDLQSI